MSVWANIMHGRTEISYSFGEDVGKEGSIAKRVEFRCGKSFPFFISTLFTWGAKTVSILLTQWKN